METTIEATNALWQNRTVTTDGEETTENALWFRDSNGNQFTVVLNERLVKRLVNNQVNQALSAIADGLIGTVDAQARQAYDAVEKNARNVHTQVIQGIRSAIKGNEYTIDTPEDVDGTLGGDTNDATTDTTTTDTWDPENGVQETPTDVGVPTEAPGFEATASIHN